MNLKQEVVLPQMLMSVILSHGQPATEETLKEKKKQASKSMKNNIFEQIKSEKDRIRLETDLAESKQARKFGKKN